MTACRAVVLVVLLALGLPSQAQGQDGTTKSATTHFAPGFVADHETYRLICRSPKDEVHADLCQQWRVANATWTVGVLSIVLLLFTLLFTGLAAFAAWRSAAAGRRAAETARDAWEKLERPYVYVFDVMLNPKRDPTKPIGEVCYDVANFGRTPAVVQEILVDLAVRTTGSQPVLTRHNNHRLLTSDSMRPDKQQDKLAQTISPVLAVEFNGRLRIPAGSDLTLYIVIRYRGPFTKGHETSGWWRYDNDSQQFVRFGEAHNYEK